jgi:two-component sensor histidine kinase
MTKWERTTGRFHVFTEADGWKSGLSSSFREDHFGNIWIGLGDGLARFRGGRFTYFTPAQGYPALGVVSMFVDHAGQLWVGTRNNGLVRLPDPGADHPQFVTYTASGGVSSNEVRAITEDHWGRIYFWTGRGVDRLEPTTGAIRHYTEADGLVMSGSDHSVAFSDRHGHLWFGADGLSRLDPEPDDPNPAPPPVRITGVRIRGIAYSVSDLGETNLSGLILDPDQNAIEIDFAGFNFGVGQVLRYQYKLEGTDHDWSPLTELRTVNYAKLRPGSYRFLVRTVNAEGIVSSSPALFTFRLLAPVWQRWWFLSLLAVTLGLIIYLGHRYRMAQVLTVERIRTRIASDLHDDVGAGLSQIAILSEVVKRETRPDGSEAGALLDHMAELSRNLVDSMGEIVWAISPRRDSLEALVQRMRRFASDVLAPRSIEFEFRVPSMDHDSSLGADVRRQVFLVFKEAVNNSARHAGCSRVSVALAFEKDALELIISDNGCGLNPTAERNGHSQGHGIESIRHRAAEMGGHMEISSGQGTGTRIDLRVPLTRRPFFSFRHKITT